MEGLKFYIKLDKELQTNLLKMLKNLITLNINSPMLSLHFEVIIFALKEKVLPRLKVAVFEMLHLSQTKKNT